MATPWVSTKGVLNLLGQFNRAFPGRDKASDGRIGDLAHQQESASSHNPDLTGAAEWRDGDAKNEERALDVDSNLRAAGVSMQDVIDHLRALPGLSTVVRYMIYNRKIYRASNGWRAETYNGASAHTEHAHFTMAFTQAADENDSFDYHFEELTDVALTPDDIKAIWAYGLENPQVPGQFKPAGDFQRYSPSYGRVDTVGTAVKSLATTFAEYAGVDHVDEVGIATAVIALLNVEQLADLIGQALNKDQAATLADLLAARLAA